MTSRRTLLMVVAALLAACASAGAQRAADKPDGKGIPVLRMVSNLRTRESGTLWRYFETWQTDVARLKSGRLVRVDPLNPRSDFDYAKFWAGAKRNAKRMEIPIREATKVTGSAFPPANWPKPDFDDSTWIRTPTPMRMNYRSLVLVCLRGKFRVKDPAQVSSLNLAASIQGGAVVYLNGQEVGRFHLPKGRITFETVAKDYPEQAFLEPSGTLLQVIGQWGASNLTEAEFTRSKDRFLNDPERKVRYAKRFRHFSLKIPTSLLRKGSNVLCIEAHRAPAHEAMFTRYDPKQMGYNLSDNYKWFWNRVSVEELTLTAQAPAGAVTANTSRPAGLQVWNWPTAERLETRTYGDPNDPVAPIRMVGARNGVFAGQVVVSAAKPIRALKADLTDLKRADGKAIGRSLIRVRYPQFYAKSRSVGFDALEDALPAEIPPLPDRYNRPTELRMQPVWLTVAVPADAGAGNYTGAVTLSAEGLKPVTVPVSLHLSDWTLPEPKDFSIYMAFIQSPDTLAIRYGVPMWSEAHWKLIDQCFQILGMIGTKDINITLVRRTHFGNEHGMVWFVKQPDGSYKPYLKIVERYIDIAVKRLGRIHAVSFYIIEQDADGRPWVTEFAPATGEHKDAVAPPWGTPEARAFWTPAFEGFRKILATRGLKKSVLALGTHAVSGGGPEPSKECIADMKQVAPEAGWVKLAHMWGAHGVEKLEKGPGGNPYPRVALVAGNYGVLWDPDTDKPFFGWRNPYPIIMYTRGVFMDSSPLRQYRLAPELILFAGLRKTAAGWGLCDIAGQFGRDTFLGTRGFGPWGADFWPVRRGRRGFRDIIGRFNSPLGGMSDPRSYWYTVGLNNFQTAHLVGEGARGPVSTVRIELLRESNQEAEAHIFCQNALADEALRKKLGPDLTRRCRDVCTRRLHALRYESEFRVFGASKDPMRTHFVFNPTAWQERSGELYDMAAEVAKALDKR